MRLLQRHRPLPATRWARVAAAVLCITFAAGGTEEVVAKDTWQPLLSKPLPDPYVFQDEGFCYITGTAMHGFRGPTLTRDAMKPFELSIDYGDLGGPFQHWGFKFYRDTEGAYHGYATVHFGHFHTAVAHYLPQPGRVWKPGQPITAWKVDKVLVGDREGKSGFAYDVEIEHDEDGRLWLIHNYSAALGQNVHIRAQRMIDPATPDPELPPRDILVPEGYGSEDRNPGFIQITEGTNLARVQGKWVLLYSVGDFALYDGRSNYKLGVAYSGTLIPPPGRMYQKVIIDDPENHWRSEGKGGREVCYLLQSQVREWPNYCEDFVRGPGLGNLVMADGKTWLVFHGYQPGTDNPGAHERHVWKLPLQVDITPAAPMQHWLRAVLPDAAARNAGE